MSQIGDSSANFSLSNLAEKSTRSQIERVQRLLGRVSQWLPTQGPLKDFIHHNTLHAFQDRPFHEGVIKASELYGSKGYLEIEEYQSRYRKGEISNSAIERALLAHTEVSDQQDNLRAQMKEVSPSPVSPGVASSGLRSRWVRERHLTLDALVHPILFRTLANYLDQGVTIWRMPHADARLWNALGRIVKESYLPFGPYSDKSCREYFKMKPEQVIEELLHKLVGDSAFYESYLLEMLLAHPGWSGMICMAESQPESLLIPRPISLLDAVAVELLLEYAFVVREFGASFVPVSEGVMLEPNPATTKVEWSRGLVMQKLWQEAFEWTYYESVLATLDLSSRTPTGAEESPLAQLYFCIDDRECSLRRHLEEINPRMETWGVPGFFGLDWLFQSAGSSIALKLCPAPLSPKHLIKEKASGKKIARPRLLQLLHLSPSNTLLRGWLITQVVGLWHGIELAWQVFRPSRRRPSDQSMSHIEPLGDLQILRTGDEKNEAGFYLGFSLQEMADRVYGVLSSVGSTSNFANLLVIVSHGASSVNNPYFAAYDCGACSGRPGAPNARAFAWMANDRRVRSLLAQKGLHIPDRTHFVGAFHDTTRDEVIYFDVEQIPSELNDSFKEVRATMEQALRDNALERCRRFELADDGMSPPQALGHVRARAASIFEPRPELNHATNALCIVGSRAFSKGVFLDRRAFLNSYDPSTDPNGTILGGIMGAAVPVCGGINLEYYFSRVDSDRYGAGTKLPHNVVGLVGVANGVEGDLLTGLPTQMTEVHDPLRLMMIVEQTPEIVLAAINGNSNVKQWVEHHWVRLVCVSPIDRKNYVYEHGKFEPLDLSAVSLAAREQGSLNLISNRSDNIAPCLIRKGKK